MSDSSLKTILVATGGYLPGKKYMGITTSRKNLIEGLSGRFNIVVLTKNHDYRETKPYAEVEHGWNDVDGMRICYLADEEITENRVIEIIEQEHVDYIYASGTITSYFGFNRQVFAAARKKRIPIVVTPDGDISPNAIRIKMGKKMFAVLLCRMMQAFRDVYFQATSKEEANALQQYLGIDKKMIAVVPFFGHKFSRRSEYIKRSGSMKLVYCSRIHPIKNLHIAISAVEQCELPIQMDIYGTIDDEKYWKMCQEIISKSDRIQYFGALSPLEAAGIYAQYDAMILPTQSENYCFAVEEALACDCPVIISRGTTPWDDVEDVAGYTVPLTNTAGFINKIEIIAKMNEEQYQQLLSSIEDYYAMRMKKESLLNLYQELFDAAADIGL